MIWFFRALGSKIGKNVCLYPHGADPMMTEPDIVEIGDNVCIDDASVIGHYNTRGNFSLNAISIGEGCVLKSNSRLLSGAAMLPNSMLLEHTLVMGGDIVDENSVWQGWPSHTFQNLPSYKNKVKQATLAAIKRSQAEADGNSSLCCCFNTARRNVLSRTTLQKTPTTMATIETNVIINARVSRAGTNESDNDSEDSNISGISYASAVSSSSTEHVIDIKGGRKKAGYAAL